MLRIEDLDGNARAFSEACFDMNSIEELQFDELAEVDQKDCKTWNITESEWKNAIEAAWNEKVMFSAKAIEIAYRLKDN